MENLFVTYDIALKLFEMGFEEPCLKVANFNGHIMWKWIDVDGSEDAVDAHDIAISKFTDQFIEVPMYSQVIDWIYKKHKVYLSVDRHHIKELDNTTFAWHKQYQDINDRKFYTHSKPGFKTAEDAYIDAIRQYIKSWETKIPLPKKH